MERVKRRSRDCSRKQADDARNDVATQKVTLGPRGRQVTLHIKVVEVD